MDGTKKSSSKSKYKIIVKVSSDRFVKYRSSNLISFTRFLDKSYKGWRYMNVYDRTGEQVANYTSKNKPTSRFVIN